MQYSTEQEKADFISKLVEASSATRQPLFVLDLDGNAVLGYNPTTSTESDDPRRNFAADADMDALVRDGLAKPALFAAKPLDARLAQPLVSQMNRLIAKGQHFSLAVLTSRSESDALSLLRDSGVREPQKATLIADSGAVMRLGGARTLLRAPSIEERQVLNGLDAALENLEPQIDDLLNQRGYDTTSRPPLEIEPKGIATNLHFRALLDHYGLEDHSPAAQAVSELVQQALQHYVQQSPAGGAFKLLHGPATLEMKLADIDKGHGLHALVVAAQEAHHQPSAVIFAGDDVCNHSKDGAVTPGTDYFAFAALPEIASNTGIPAFGIHTQHNLSASLEGGAPNPAKAIVPMAAPYDAGIKAELTVPSPLALGALVDSAISQCASRAAGYSGRTQAPHGASQRFR